MKLQTSSRFFQAKRLQKVVQKLPKSLPIIPVMVAISFMLLAFSGVVYHQASLARQQKALDASTASKERATANLQQGSTINPVSGTTTTPPPTRNGNGSPTSSSPSYKPSTPSSSSKPYTPYNCVKTVLPYKTNYKLASYLGSGSTNVIGGKEGYTSVCTSDSNGQKPNDANIPPVDRTIYVGDGGGSLSVSPHPQSEPYDVVYARAIPACDELLQITGNDPTAKQWCINNVVAGILHYYGY